MPIYVCPTCQKSTNVEDRQQAPDRPFCSDRCKMIDLGKWLDGSYCTSEPVDPHTIDDMIDAPNMNSNIADDANHLIE